MRSAAIWSTIVASAAILGLLFSASLGDYVIPPPAVAQALIGVGDPSNTLVVVQFRLPRALCALLAGAALGLAGAIVQGITHNPLATPDLLGVSAGASVASVAVIVGTGAYGSVSGMNAALWVPLAAIVGGLISAGFVFAVGRRSRLGNLRLLLVGLGTQAFLASITSWLLVQADIVDAGRAYVWLIGSLNGRSYTDVTTVAAGIVAATPVVALSIRQYGGLALDVDSARSLGVRVERTQSSLLIVAVILTATATAAVGPIAFVALAAPQIAVRLLGSPITPLGTSAWLGAAITVWSDVVARQAFGDIQLPVGIVTAGLGSIYLAYLLTRPGRFSRL